jgi:TonB family protein
VIAVWMVYCSGIGLAFVVVGFALERGLHLAGRPTRWAWVIALLGSYVVPIAAWLRPEAFATFPAPISVAVESSGPSSLPTSSSTILDQPASRPFSLSDLDVPLRWGWGLASVAMLFVLAVAVARLVSQRRRWRQAAVDGRLVLVSGNIGPAVVGVWGPRVVLPEWALALPAHDRELMLAHEEQHVRASDPVLLAAGFLAVLLAPWNPALWWQWRRLRLAVEIDCDTRVLAQGRSAPAYGELLLEVGRRRNTHLLGAAALGEPASFLESRIRRMLATTPRWRWAGVAATILVAVGTIVGACEAPRPLSPTNALREPQAPSPVGIVGVVSGVVNPTDLDQAPVLLADAYAEFPDLPRFAGIEGRVVLQVRIDTDGRVDPSSVVVLQSPHPAFAEAAKSAVLRSLFRPAWTHGRAVDAVARLSYDFVKDAAATQRRSDIHALVRPAIKADETIQALQPPTVVYVWFQAMPDGRIVAHGREDSRANLIRHAAGMGRIKTQGFAPAGVLAPVKVVYALVEMPWYQMTDRMTLREAERLRPWVENNARRMMPVILELGGPSMDAFLVHDSKLQVYRTSLVTLDYLNGKRPDAEIGVAALRNVLPAFNPGHDGWGVVDPRGLRGLVRDNVRVIRINHDPEPQDTAASSNGLSMQELNLRAEQLRRLARQYHPEMMGRSGSPSAIALVLNSHEQVVAHAASAGEPVGRESCIDVLTRLVPQYKRAQWSQTGCAIEKQSNLIVYWGELLKP